MYTYIDTYIIIYIHIYIHVCVYIYIYTEGGMPSAVTHPSLCCVLKRWSVHGTCADALEGYAGSVRRARLTTGLLK